MNLKFNQLLIWFFASVIIGVAISYKYIYLLHILLFIILLFLINYLTKKQKLKSLPSKLHYIFFFMLFWYYISLIWSINYEYTIKYLGYIFIGMTIVLISIYYMSFNIINQVKAFNIMFIFICLEIIFSLLEIFTSFRLPVSPFSSLVTYFGRHVTYDPNLDNSVISILLSYPTGFEWNPNNLAIAMLIFLPFFLNALNKKIKFLGSISIFIIILMSGSRGAFISLIFLIFIYMLMTKKRFLLSLSILPLLLSILFIGLDDLKHSSNQKIKEMAYSFEALNSYLFKKEDIKNSIGERQKLINNGLKVFSEHYLLGVGGGASQEIQKEEGGTANITSMHNFWIEILVESGIIFFIIFVSWYIYIIFLLYKVYKSTKVIILEYFASSLFLSMVVFIPACISASSVIYFFPMWIMFGLAISTINNYRMCNEITISR